MRHFDTIAQYMIYLALSLLSPHEHVFLYFFIKMSYF